MPNSWKGREFWFSTSKMSSCSGKKTSEEVSRKKSCHKTGKNRGEGKNLEGLKRLTSLTI